MQKNMYHQLRDNKKLNRIRDQYPHLHQCADKTFLPDYYVCDGHNDCSDGGDEENCSDICSFHQTKQNECFTSCQKPNCECSDVYFQCESGGCIPSSKICDCYNDCSDRSDESAYLCSVLLCNLPEMNRTKSRYLPSDFRYFSYVN